ncbi:hypothetical protein ASE60_22700 [Ensifer sp. Root278]|nr:hypothetical protein ASE60_22700 [Ensifer sp. Root278]
MVTTGGGRLGKNPQATTVPTSKRTVAVMTTEAKKTPARKKRTRRRKRVDPVYYIVEVQEWDWSFWFGVSNMPERYGPYDDYRHLVFCGKLLRPSKVKAESVELSFLPNQHLNEGQRERDQPLSIGHLSVHRRSMSGVLSMPADALPSLLTMATAGRLRYVVMQGEKLHYGQASLKSFRFEMKIDEDDLPPET